MSSVAPPMNWLLLRGLARDQRHWMDFGKIFEERLSGSRVFMLDMPGMGDQNKRPSPLTIPGIVDDLRHRWKQLDYDFGGPWGILAVSLGGTAAAEHGLGKVKRSFLSLVHPPEVVRAMKAVKASFDPAGLFAPGNLFNP